MNYFILILILIGAKNICSSQIINIEINENKEYYTEFININEIENDSLVFNVLSKKNSRIEKILTKNSDLKIHSNFNGKKRKEIHFTVFKNSNSIFNKREKIILQDFNGRNYYIAVCFYSKAINIDSIKKNSNLVYKKNDYPIFLKSNSCVIGKFLISDENSKLKYKFELLSSFGLYLENLENGKY